MTFWSKGCLEEKFLRVIAKSGSVCTALAALKIVKHPNPYKPLFTVNVFERPMVHLIRCTIS